MKKKYIFTGLFLGMLLSSRAQLVNNGGTITLQQGAYLVCTGNLTNTSGTITNDGRIEVKGSFANSGTYNSTSNEDSLIMSGSGNATLSPGAAVLNFLTINKAANTDFVTLTASTTVNTKLDYLSGVLSTDYANNPAYVLSAPATAVFNFAPGREVIGNVKRTGWASGSMVLFNSAQMQIATNDGTAPTDITVTMLPQANGGDPSLAEREVKRKFLLAQNGGSGFTADVRFPYSASVAELNTNVEGNLVPWTLVSSEWNARLTSVARDVANKWVSTTAIPATSFAQEWKLADPNYSFNIKAYLRGPWNGATMNTSLNSAGLLPLGQPYNTTPFNYVGTESVPSIPNSNVVDWVLVELRKPSTGLASDASSSTIIGRKAGFLLNNGTVVDLDGSTPIHFDIGKQGASYVVVRHRNHLGVMSNSLPSNALGTFANDFSAVANAYKNPGISSQPMVLLSGSTYGFWSGDANKSGNLAATDITAIKVAIANGLSGYQLTDVNLSGNLAASDVNLAKLMISQGGQGSTSARAAVGGAASSSKVQSNIPDIIVE